MKSVEDAVGAVGIYSKDRSMLQLRALDGKLEDLARINFKEVDRRKLNPMTR